MSLAQFTYTESKDKSWFFLNFPFFNEQSQITKWIPISAELSFLGQMIMTKQLFPFILKQKS